jgi:6-phosphogluconolactonase (cycloisomerase 2 family)
VLGGSATFGAAICLTLAVAATPPETSPPKPELVQTLQSGKDIRVRAFNAIVGELAGGFLYVCGEDGISGFKRDLSTGKLTFVENLAEPKCGGYAIRAAGGRLYAVTPHAGSRRMTWHGLASFDIDAATGKLTRKDVTDCPPSQQIVASPDGKNIYVKTAGSQPDKVLWFRLDAAGKPTRAGEAAGKGIGPTGHGAYPNLLVASPDENYLYCISADDHAIACIARKATGEINHVGATDLAGMAPRDPNGYRYQWASLAISPDGKWLYAALWNGKRDENRCGVFRRDPATGELTLKDTLAGDKFPPANLRGWNLAFAPDGSGAFLGNWTGPVMTLRYDSQTGQLSDPKPVTETKGFSSLVLMLDAANGFLYCGGPLDDFCNYDGLEVLKVEKAAAK